MRASLSYACLVSLTVWGACIGSVAYAAEADSQETSKKAAALVEQLGHAEYAERESASEELIKMGLVTKAALTAGLESYDREIRHRCIRILHIVEEADFQRRLDAFVKGDDESISFPAWGAFKQQFGDDAPTRKLFVELQKAEQQSLKAVDDGPQAISSMLVKRTTELQQMMGVYRQQLSYGNVAAMIFMASVDKVELTPQVSSMLYGFCYQPNFRNELMNGDRKEISRRLMGAWIRRGEGWTLYQALNLAMQYGLEEGLEPAQRALREGPNQPHILQYAILAIARFGDREDIVRLSPLLTKAEGKNRIGSQRINNVTYEAQLRDVALAAMIHLAGENPRDYGFDKYQENPQNVFNPGTVGFRSEEDRTKAQEKWAEKSEQIEAEINQPPEPEGRGEPDAPPAP